MINSNSKHLDYKKRIFILASSFCIWFFSFRIFKPWIVSFYSNYINTFEEGSRLFLNHTFVFSTPTAILCLIWILVLNKLQLIPKILFQINKKAFYSGIIWGLAIAVITLIIAPLLGATYGFHFNIWSIAGNFTSNLGEEIIFRGLLFFSLWSFLGTKPASKYFAILISGLIFGLTHEQYPWALRGYISVIGCCLSYLSSQENNLMPAIVAHDLSDWILDLFL